MMRHSTQIVSRTHPHRDEGTKAARHKSGRNKRTAERPSLGTEFAQSQESTLSENEKRERERHDRGRATPSRSCGVGQGGTGERQGQRPESFRLLATRMAEPRRDCTRPRRRPQTLQTEQKEGESGCRAPGGCRPSFFCRTPAVTTRSCSTAPQSKKRKRIIQTRESNHEKFI